MRKGLTDNQQLQRTDLSHETDPMKTDLAFLSYAQRQTHLLSTRKGPTTSVEKTDQWGHALQKLLPMRRQKRKNSTEILRAGEWESEHRQFTRIRKLSTVLPLFHHQLYRQQPSAQSVITDEERTERKLISSVFMSQLGILLVSKSNLFSWGQSAGCCSTQPITNS